MPFPFEIALDPVTFAVLAGMAFLAGFIDAIAGGGGLITVPALLTAGLPPHLVLGTNKLSATFGSAVASFTFFRRGLFDPLQWSAALVATAIGALLGAGMAHQIPARWLNQALPVIVFACGLYLLFNRAPDRTPDPTRPLAKRRQWPQGWPWAPTMVWWAPVPGPSGRSAPCCCIPSIWCAPAEWRAA